MREITVTKERKDRLYPVKRNSYDDGHEEGRNNGPDDHAEAPKSRHVRLSTGLRFMVSSLREISYYYL